MTERRGMRGVIVAGLLDGAVALIRRPSAGVSTIEACPPDGFRLVRFTRDAGALKEVYEQGRAMAIDAIMQW